MIIQRVGGVYVGLLRGVGVFYGLTRGEVVAQALSVITIK